MYAGRSEGLPPFGTSLFCIRRGERGLFVLLDGADEGGGVVAADDVLFFVDVFDEDEAAPTGGAETKEAALAEVEVEAVVPAEAVDAPKGDAVAHLAGFDEADVADVGEGDLDELHDAVDLDGVGGDAHEAGDGERGEQQQHDDDGGEPGGEVAGAGEVEEEADEGADEEEGGEGEPPGAAVEPKAEFGVDGDGVFHTIYTTI